MTNAIEQSVPAKLAAPVASALWTVRECAAYLQKSPRWLWSALKRRPEEPGSIPHVRIGNSARFIPSDIEAWVRQGCPPASMFRHWLASEEKQKKAASRP